MSRYHRSYRQDPYWLVARFDSPCGHQGCTETVRRGQRAFYYPITRRAYCPQHSQEAAADFASMAADEAQLSQSGGW